MPTRHADHRRDHERRRNHTHSQPPPRRHRNWWRVNLWRGCGNRGRPSSSLQDPYLKDWRVTAALQSNDDRILSTRTVVGTVDLRPQAARLDPNDRIDPGIVLIVAVEHLAPDHVLLELPAFTRDRTLDDVFEEPSKPVRPSKARTRKNALELRLDLICSRHWSHYPANPFTKEDPNSRSWLAPQTNRRPTTPPGLCAFEPLRL